VERERGNEKGESRWKVRGRVIKRDGRVRRGGRRGEWERTYDEVRGGVGGASDDGLGWLKGGNREFALI